MSKAISTLILIFSFCVLPTFSWSQCTTADCPSNDNSCNGDPNCCLATGTASTSIDDCLTTAGISIIRVKYAASISSGTDATNALICLASNNDLTFASDVIVDNTTCIAANGNNDVTIIINGNSFVFNAGPELDELNNALGNLPSSTTIGAVVTALPVELESYHANNVSEGILLDWTTLRERDNEYFLIERSANGRLYEELGRVYTKENSSQKQYYQFLDQKANTGYNYYRLTQVDFDGTSANLGIIQIQKDHKASFSFSPNPVISGNTISLHPFLNEVESSSTSFQLINALGQTWPLSYDHGSLLIPNGLSKGLYHLMVTQFSNPKTFPIIIK